MGPRRIIGIGALIGAVPLLISFGKNAVGREPIGGWHLVLSSFDELMFFGISLALTGIIDYCEAVRVAQRKGTDVDEALSYGWWFLLVLGIFNIVGYVVFEAKNDEITSSASSMDRNWWLAASGTVLTIATLVASVLIQLGSKRERDRWI